MQAKNKIKKPVGVFFFGCIIHLHFYTTGWKKHEQEFRYLSRSVTSVLCVTTSGNCKINFNMARPRVQKAVKVMMPFYLSGTTQMMPFYLSGTTER
jgi:hypothetical protein